VSLEFRFSYIYILNESVSLAVNWLK
jgi:hypothetical protein